MIQWAKALNQFKRIELEIYKSRKDFGSTKQRGLVPWGYEEQ